ncbi:MAG: HIT domain-containing protein [Firmicutes bacterium]|nr:HIT domain-containing protein [Bacillota bacterium]
MDCIFCKIINGDIPALKVYEDDLVLAFLDINPDTNGHTLIIPKKHFTDLDDIDLNTLTAINEVSKKLKKLLEEKLGCDGISLLQNNGLVQEVKHYHLHLKPCYKDKNSIETIKHHELISDPKEIYKKLK